MKVAFKNTIFWCSIWALIHSNHLYNLDLIWFKAYSTPTCISIPLSNLGCFFQKISITYDLGQNCWDKRENAFFSAKTALPPNQCCWKFLSFWQQSMGRFNIGIARSGGEFWIIKIESFLEFTGFSTFASTRFA